MVIKLTLDKFIQSEAESYVKTSFRTENLRKVSVFE